MGKKTKLDAMDAYGRTPLHLATEQGQVGFIRELLEQGANVHARDQWGIVPLHNAALCGDTEIISLLLEKGADVNAPDENNTTPLHFAVMANRKHACSLLIGKGARIDSRDIFGETALDWLAARGRPDILEPFAVRAAQPGVNVVELINRSPLHRAAKRGETTIMNLLLSKGAQLNAADTQGRIPLHWAAYGGKEPAVKLLIEKGSPIDAVDKAGRTPLHHAAINGHTDIAALLLNNSADINAKDKNGRTPLFLALHYSREKTAQLLQEKGADTEKTHPHSLLLQNELNEKEAIMWHMGHCGWVVKTKKHLLIFDYWQKQPNPGPKSLANGFINPDEIKNLDVTVFVTHPHPDHYDEAIFQWEPVIKNINYIFGWDAGKGGKHTYMKKPRAKTKIKGMNIYTIPSNHSYVPEVAYLVLVDGLALYHSGDYIGALRSFKDDIDYLAKKCDGVDIAFSGATIETGRYTMERLLPRVAFPMHFGDSEFIYNGIIDHFSPKFPKTTFIAPENRGDRYHYQNNQITQII